MTFLVMHSRNEKVGDVAATYAPISQTCPESCPLKGNGCYAQSGNVGFAVNRLERQLDGANGDTVAVLEGDEIADASRHAPPGHPLRIHVSGDSITPFRAAQQARGAARWPGPVWSYTHAWGSVPRASWGRVSVLASCETLAGAQLAMALGYAVALVVPSHPENGRAERRDGVKLIPCPAQTRDVTCEDCRLCWDDTKLLEQRACITFAAHGASRKRTLAVLRA